MKKLQVAVLVIGLSVALAVSLPVASAQNTTNTNQTISNLRNIIAEKNATIQSLRNKTKEQNATIQSLKNKLKSQEENISSLKENLKNLRSEVKNAKIRISDRNVKVGDTVTVKAVNKSKILSYLPLVIKADGETQAFSKLGTGSFSFTPHTAGVHTIILYNRHLTAIARKRFNVSKLPINIHVKGEKSVTNKLKIEADKKCSLTVTNTKTGRTKSYSGKNSYKFEPKTVGKFNVKAESDNAKGNKTFVVSGTPIILVKGPNGKPVKGSVKAGSTLTLVAKSGTKKVDVDHFKVVMPSEAYGISQRMSIWMSMAARSPSGIDIVAPGKIAVEVDASNGVGALTLPDKTPSSTIMISTPKGKYFKASSRSISVSNPLVPWYVFYPVLLIILGSVGYIVINRFGLPGKDTINALVAKIKSFRSKKKGGEIDRDKPLKG